MMFESLVYRAAIPLYYQRVRWFLRHADRSAQVQRQRLFAKIRRQAASDFGRQHGFSSIRTIEDFRRQVPVANYEYYRSYVERLKTGETTAMFAPGTEVLMFAMTSGTTDRSKFLPVTREFFQDYRRSWHIWGAASYADHVDQTRKKSLQLTSNWRQAFTDSGLPCGNISGLAAEVTPWFTRRVFVVPLPVIRIDDPAVKHYTALRLTLTAPNVGMIITANPSTLIEFAKRADRQKETLIRDIFDGTLSAPGPLPTQVESALTARIRRRDPPRARQLEAIAARTGTLYPKDFWPELSLLAVWMGGSVGVYLPRLQDYYGQAALRDHGLSASEGRMTIPLRDGTSCGMLDYVHHYYEFIPEEEIDSSQPTVLEAHELQPGKHYFILLTTSAGLYRYDIHDVVRCDGFEGQVPLLTFLNKGAHFSSLTGEKLSEFQVVTAVQRGFAECGLPVESFTVAPVISGEQPGYVLLVERGAGHDQRQPLIRSTENHLKELNCEYADKVASGRLEPLALREIHPGTWARFQQQRTAERGNLEEFKHPCLVADLQFADRISRLMDS